MKGQLLEHNSGKGYRKVLLVADKQVKGLTKQGRALVFLLDEDLNHLIEDGKKVMAIVHLKDTKLIGFQD